MSDMPSISMYLDTDAFKLYVKLNGRMSNKDFYEKFLGPVKVLGFRFDASRVSHGIVLEKPQECSLLIRQLEHNFRISQLEKSDIMYWLGLDVPEVADKYKALIQQAPTH